jgi:hypothetical protein
MVSIHCSVVGNEQQNEMIYYGRISDDLTHDQSYVISVVISTIQAEILETLIINVIYLSLFSQRLKR